ncbi:MAG TPA: recombination-associated protein RdgC [Stenotrophobium sp.]|jgi:recombination associated protein RdgC|nr:recombination-associated protein RdgC [Stenotrophobium sp.]
MWFRNLQIYRLPENWQMPAGQLEEHLARHPLLPCSGMSMQSRGWVAPREDGQLVCSQGRNLLIALGTEQKILPASVINQAAKEMAAQLEAQQGFKPGRKQMRDIKERVTTELLPRAFARRRVVRAWLDPVNRWLVVDASSPARAEELTEALRDALGELSVLPLQTRQSPATAMTAWLNAAEVPGNFVFDQDCELCGSDESKSTVRYVRHGLDGKDIRQHIASGKAATRLGLVWNDRMACVLTEQHQVKRVKFLAMEKNREDDGMQNPDEQFDADFTLMTGELHALMTDLVMALGGEDA